MPTGTVTFLNGGISLGTAALSGATMATATFTTGTLNVPGSPYTITAVYAGDALSTTSSNPTAYLQTLTKAGTTTAVASSANASVFGQNVTFTATVSSNATGMTGVVTFLDGSTTLGTATLGSGNVATVTTSFTAPGTHGITAVYAGDSNFTGSTGTLSGGQTVNQASTTTTLASSNSTQVLGRNVTYTATVGIVSPGAGSLTGTVTFLDGGTSFGTGTSIGSGRWAFSTSALTTGTHSLQAVYGSDANFASSTSTAFNQVVDTNTLSWIGNASNNWSGANWQGPSGENVTPINNDSLIFPTTTHTAPTDDLSGLTINSITIAGTGYMIGGGNTLGLSGGISNTGSSNTVTLPLALTVAQTFSAAAGTSLTVSGTVAADGNLLSIAGAGRTTLSGALSGSGGLAKNDSGTLTLNAANSGFSGNTTVSAGVVNVANTGALGSGTVTESGGKVSLQAAGGSIGLQFEPMAGTALAATDVTGVVPQAYWTVSTAQSGTASNLKDSSNTTTIGAVTWTASSKWTSPSGGSGAFAKLMSAEIKNAITATITSPYPRYDLYFYINSDNAGSWSIGDGTTTYYGSCNNSLATFQQVTNTTAGTYPAGNYVRFAGETAGTITGNFNIAGGESGICGLQIVNAAAGYANNFAVTGNATLDVTGAALAPMIGTLTIGSQTLSVTGGSTGTNAAYTLTTGAVTVSGNPTFDVAKNGSGTGTLVLGSLDGAGTARTITIQDNGAVTLGSAASSLIDGSTVNVNGGTLNLNAAGALGSLVNVTMSDSASVNLGANQTLGALNSSSTTAGIGLGANVLTIGDGNNLSGSFAGVIAGNGGVIKAGTGTATLAGANTYTSGTTITAGTLLANTPGPSNSATGAGIVTVNSGATLGGTGRIAGAVTVNSGGTLKPGTSSTAPSVLTAGSVTLNGGNLLVDVNGYGTAGTNYDQLTLGSGTLTVGGGSTLTVDLANLSSAGTATGVVLYGSRPDNSTFNTVTVLHNSRNYTVAPVYSPTRLDLLIGCPTAVSLASSSNASVFGQPVTFTVQVTGTGTPAGTVTLQDGSTTLATALLSGGSATLSYAALHVTGSAHTITAVYGGNGDNLGSTSAAVTQTVSQDSTTTMLALPSNPSVFGQSIILTATVSPASPGTLVPSSGLVTFYDGPTSLAVSRLDASGSATYTTGALNVATHSIIAVYSDGSDFTGSTASSFMLTVNQATTTATLTSSNSAQVSGRTVALTAAVAVVSPGMGMPTGLVTFEDGSTSLGVATVSAGVATLTASFTAPGTHALTVTYAGDSNFTGTSASYLQTISAATLTWTGGDGSNNWSTPGNWVGPDPSENQVTPRAGDDLVFAGSTRLSNTNDTAAGTLYNSITFASGGFTSTGNALTVASAITANNAAGTTDNLNVAVIFSTAAPVIAVSTIGAALSLGGSVNNGGLLLTMAGAGTTTIGGVLSGSGGLTVSGTGTLTLTAANSYSGGTTINAGTLLLKNTAAADGSAITVNGGNLINNAGTLANAITLAGGTLGVAGGDQTYSGTITVTASADMPANVQLFDMLAPSTDRTVNFTGVLAGSGSLTVNANSTNSSSNKRLDLQQTGVNSGFSGVITLNTNAVLRDRNSGSNFSLGTGSIVVNADGGNGTKLELESNSSVTFANAVTIQGSGTARIDVNNLGSNSGNTLTLGGPFTMSAQTLSVTGGNNYGLLIAGDVTLADMATINLNTAGINATISGAISGSGGLTKTGSQTLALSGAGSYSGATTIAAGTLKALAAGVLSATSRSYRQCRGRARPERFRQYQRLAGRCRQRVAGRRHADRRQRQYLNDLHRHDRQCSRQSHQDRYRHADPGRHDPLHRGDHGQRRHASGQQRRQPGGRHCLGQRRHICRHGYRRVHYGQQRRHRHHRRQHRHADCRFRRL